MSLIEPENKIRATVIGAGAFSLSVSGSTCYYDQNINLPLVNIPVVPVNLDIRKEKMFDKVQSALKNFDLKQAKIENIKADLDFLPIIKKQEASTLIIQAFDSIKKKQEKAPTLNKTYTDSKIKIKNSLVSLPRPVPKNRELKL